MSDDTSADSPAPMDNNIAPAARPQRPATLVFTQAVLLLQAFAALFATLLISGLARAGDVDVPAGAIWGVGLGTVLLLGYASGQQKKTWGRYLGWVLQLPMIAAGFVDTAVAIIGVMFLGLWIMGLRLGGRIDRERAERLAAEGPEGAAGAASESQAAARDGSEA